MITGKLEETQSSPRTQFLRIVDWVLLFPLLSSISYATMQPVTDLTTSMLLVPYFHLAELRVHQFFFLGNKRETCDRHSTHGRISHLSRAVIFEGHVLTYCDKSHWLTKTHNKIHGLLLYGLCLLLQQLILPVFFILAPTRHHPS